MPHKLCKIIIISLFFQHFNIILNDIFIISILGDIKLNSRCRYSSSFLLIHFSILNEILQNNERNLFINRSVVHRLRFHIHLNFDVLLLLTYYILIGQLKYVKKECYDFTFQLTNQNAEFDILYHIMNFSRLGNATDDVLHFDL